MEGVPPPTDDNDDEEQEEEEWMSDAHNNETGTSNRARFPSAEEMDTDELPPLPRRQEPTLKERLVERERQARVETERARLKRQFALSSNGGAASSDLHHRENGSVEGTVGEESSVAAPPTDQGEENEDNEDDRKKLGYVMERFLRGDVKEEEEQVEKPKPEPGVLMERFLAEPVVVEQGAAVVAETQNEEVGEEENEGKVPAQEGDAPDASRQHDNDGTNDIPLPPPISATMSHDDSELEATVGSIRSYSTVTNASLAQVGTIDVLEEGGEATTEGPPSSFQGERSVGLDSEDEPRVLRLTEAEIQEMAAIEEASIGNAPPSERDDTFSESSLVGDLLGDLDGGPRGLDPAGDFSAGTTTTALESASITSVGGDDLSSRSPAIEIETRSVDVIESASVSSHLVVSPGASGEGSVSIIACPPSVNAGEEPSMLGPDGVALPSNDVEGSAMLEMLSFERNDHDGTNASLECAPSFEDSGGLLDVEAAAAANAGVTNRQSRQGRPRMPPPTRETPVAQESDASQKKVHIMLEGFDYDRSAQDPLEHTPHSRGMDSYNELPGDDPWSPAVATGEMSLSPLQPESTFAASRTQAAPGYPNLDVTNGDVATGAGGAQASVVTYGSVEARGHQVSPPKDFRLGLLRRKDANQNETLPLVGNRDIEEEGDHENRHLLKDDLKHAMSNVFSSLRSDSTGTIQEVNTDSEQYLVFSIFKRGMFACRGHIMLRCVC